MEAESEASAIRQRAQARPVRNAAGDMVITVMQLDDDAEAVRQQAIAAALGQRN